ncbi:MAG TPA: tRNA pseudouridine(55) synthase TruB [Candidatus Saccharimonadia bacterium]|nr:tRNA pseudouridine(55) synthase TruB [Candidatus Saccharimonadia bacterium]
MRRTGGGPAGPTTRIDGILLLDKPGGMSSNAALQRVKRALGADKAGHTGSLDPMATGMLPLCLGEATKVAGLLLGARKCYFAHVRLGTTTTTLDADGAVLEQRAVPPLDDGALRELLARYTGSITQRPPAYSAIKRDGVPLYRLARQGIAVEAPLREVVIESIELLARDTETFAIRVVCGSGTYIRSLAADIGEALGCGAHLVALRRAWVDPFGDAAMLDLDSIEAAPDAARERLLPLEAGVAGRPRVDFAAGEAAAIAHGIAQAPAGLDWTGPGCAFGPDGHLVALVERSADGVVRARRVLVRP